MVQKAPMLQKLTRSKFEIKPKSAHTGAFRFDFKPLRMVFSFVEAAVFVLGLGHISSRCPTSVFSCNKAGDNSFYDTGTSV